MKRTLLKAGWVAAVFMLGSISPGAASLTVSIQPPVTCAELGDTVDVAVNTTGQDSVGWYYARVYTDEAVLTYLDCTTEILGECPSGSQCMECGLTGEPGIFSACCACLGTHTCVAAGDLVVIRYVVTGEGTSPVQFDTSFGNPGVWVDDCDRNRIPLDSVEDGIVYVGAASITTDREYDPPSAWLTSFSCRPNPFTREITLTYRIRAFSAGTPTDSDDADLKIYDCRGCLVRSIPASLSTGEHSAIWDGTDSRNGQVASGIYFCRLPVNGRVTTHKIMKLE
ncbi:MAG: FlgD immunoglobulin-like domain containing protein [Candidatus Eisenbacteria bacterium]